MDSSGYINKTIKEALKEKGRRYVDNPSEAPGGVDVQEGPQGGLYYETGGIEPESTESPGSSDGEGPEGSGSETEEYVPKPEEDVPRFMESEETTEMVTETNEAPMNGFTVQRNLEPYDYWSEDAWTVGITSIEVSTEEGLSKEDVTEFYEQWADVLEEQPGLRIGGYHFDDGSKISVDLSVMVSDEEEAMELGETLKQESIFHPKKAMESDFAEGSVQTYEGEDVGQSPVETPEDINEVLENIDSIAKRILEALRRKMEKQMAEEQPDMDTEFVSDHGDVMTRKNIALAVRHQNYDVEPTDDGYVINGEAYRKM